jgi:prepilin-type N-terminal cleavage/methylation domain-containing protein
MSRLARRGFTLVEMLVVMGLIVVLAGLTVAVAESGAFGSQKVVTGADRVSGWLLIAKQRALRDGKPRGVRFLLERDVSGNVVVPFRVREAQYIEEAVVFDPGANIPAIRKPYLVFAYQQAAMGSPGHPGLKPNQPVPTSPTAPYSGQRVGLVFPTAQERNDFLALGKPAIEGRLLVLPKLGGQDGKPWVGRIDQLFMVTLFDVRVQGVPQQAVEFTLGPDGATTTGNYTYPDLSAGFTPAALDGVPQTVTHIEHDFVIAADPKAGDAQPLVGEPLLQLNGQSIVIDARTGTSQTSIGVRLQTAAAEGFFDVLFAPSGEVLGADGGLIALWVRDADKAADPRADFDAAGEQVLVTVYPKTGLIATHPVSRGADPYLAARDGLNSGL